MEWNEILVLVLRAIITVVVSVGVPMLVKHLQSKINSDTADKLVAEAGEIVKKAVIAVDQTYVDSLKNSNAFTREAQETALAQCKETVLALLNDEAKKAVVNSCGDIETWLTVMIEAAVREQK